MAVGFYELLDAIRLRPAMYLSKPSLTALYNFIGGYSFHEESRIEMLKGTNPPFPEFHIWVSMKLETLSLGWLNLLLEAENGNEEKAFQRFFVYLDEFRQRQAKIIMWAKLPPNDSRRTQVIHIVKYTDDEGVFIRYIGNNDELIEESYWGNLENTLWIIESQIGVLDWQTSESKITKTIDK
jgi:hypothetical protein